MLQDDLSIGVTLSWGSVLLPTEGRDKTTPGSPSLCFHFQPGYHQMVQCLNWWSGPGQILIHLRIALVLSHGQRVVLKATGSLWLPREELQLLFGSLMQRELVVPKCPWLLWVLTYSRNKFPQKLPASRTSQHKGAGLGEPLLS